MPKLIVVASPVGPDKEVDVPEGGELVDVSDRTLLPIPFSCRSASCGTCHIEVLEGRQYLEAPEEDELDLLDIIGGSPQSRLACQAKLKAGAGLVRVRPA
jgi:2Fe-2S ferredoxin